MTHDELGDMVRAAAVLLNRAVAMLDGEQLEQCQHPDDMQVDHSTMGMSYKLLECGQCGKMYQAPVAGGDE